MPKGVYIRTEEWKENKKKSLQNPEVVRHLKEGHQKALLNPEYHRRLSEGGKYIRSKECKRINSLSKMGVKNPNYGKPRTEETKRKIRESNKKTWANPVLRDNHKQYGWKTCLLIRKNGTNIERKVKKYLQELNIKFIEQKIIDDIELSFMCDFYLSQYNIVIECDGNYWHDYPNRRPIDKARTSQMITKGYKVIRLWETDILEMSLNKFNDKILITNGEWNSVKA